ncbi:hypothetical protein, partial [Pseudomonas kitaguniensis]|uniref:hypothetical protein n=1 Tax=Pseudomonas kitaguniensis TaxID=2607908 RepID=UPI0019D62CA3
RDTQSLAGIGGPSTTLKKLAGPGQGRGRKCDALESTAIPFDNFTGVIRRTLNLNYLSIRLRHCISQNQLGFSRHLTL